jgi:hypothetical protein
MKNGNRDDARLAVSFDRALVVLFRERSVARLLARGSRGGIRHGEEDGDATVLGRVRWSTAGSLADFDGWRG